MRKLIGWVLFISLAIIVFLLLQKGETQYADIALSDFHSRLQRDNVAWVEVRDDRLVGEFRNPEQVGPKGSVVAKFRTALPSGTTANWQFMNWLLDNRGAARVQVARNQSLLLNIVLPLIPSLLIFGLIWYFTFRHIRRVPPGTPLKVFVVNQPGEPPPATPPAM